MSEQEEYLDRLLNGINEDPEDALEEFSFDDADMDTIGDIDGDDLFAGEALSFEDIDPLMSDGMEQDTGLDASEFGFGEDDFKLDEEDLDFVYDGDTDENPGTEAAGDEAFSLEESDTALEDEDLNGFSDAFFEEEEEQSLKNGEELGETMQDMAEFGVVEDGVEETADMAEADIEEAVAPDVALEDVPSAGDESEDEQDDMLLDTMVMDEPEIAKAPETEIAEEPETAEELDDAQALANILSAFSDEENGEEEALAEEAVLDTPELLGLELEEVEEPGEELEAEIKPEKKKKEKKNKIKKKEKNPDNKKSNLITRLLEDDADEEPTQEELEAAEAKKAEKAEKKQAKKAAAAEKKQQAKEAAASKKAEKEAEKKRKAEAEEPPEPWPAFTKKIIPFVILFGATFVVLIVILSSVLSYSPYVSNARKYFDDRQYGKAYEQLMGIKIKEKDQNFYDQVKLMNQLQVKVTSCENHLLNEERELALNDLVQAVLFYNEYLEKARELGLEKEFQVVYADIETDLSGAFGISVEEAAELGAISDATEYQERVSDIVK